MDQGSLELTEILLPLPPLLGLKICTTKSGPGCLEFMLFETAGSHPAGSFSLHRVREIVGDQ